MGAARFTIVTPECIRLEYSPSREFVDAPSLFARERAATNARVVPDGDADVDIDTGRVVLRYRADGRGFTPENLSVRIGEREWRPGMRNERNLGGTLETLDRVRDRVPLPDGLLSRDGWCLFDDSKTHLLVDGWATPRPSNVRGNSDWYFFGYGTDYRAALKSLAAVAGPVPMPRRYALGSWYSRYWPYTSGEYREIVAEYDRRGYPLDVIVMDMDWHKPGWTGWSWNRELLPDAEELLEWFHENGLAVTLNLHPALGVGPHEDEYAAFTRAIGKDPATGETVAFDAGDRRYADALFKCVHEPLERGQSGHVGGGVDFWWLDWQQEKFTRSIPDLSNLRWLNYLYFEHTARQGRGCSFSRWAGWGDHRHPVHFSGDAHTGWESLAFQVPFTATAGNVGCFFWSHDIGGHFGPRLEEATTRWVQFGALSPVLRLHSARSGALDRRPWTYKPEYDAAMRSAFRLRSELFPYLYSMARKCHTEMLPLCRPMYIDWPEEEAAYKNPQQYMLGDSLLVAPITSPGVGPKKVATQAVWFPATSPTRERGASAAPTWYNYHTGERYEPGTEQLVAAEIDEIPLFVPGGVPIVTRDVTLRMATAPLEKLVVVCYPGEPETYHEFELYEDDGISNAHERGEYSVTPVRVWWFDSEVKVEVGIRIGSFKGMVQDREVVLELRCVERATRVRVDDQPLREVEGAERRVRIEGGRLGADQVTRFDVRFDWADAAQVRRSLVLRRLSDLSPLPVGTSALDHVTDEVRVGRLSLEQLSRMLDIGWGIGLVHVDGAVRLFNGSGSNYERLGDDRADVIVVDRRGTSDVPRSKEVIRVAPASSSLVPISLEPLGQPPLGLRASRRVEASFSVDDIWVVLTRNVEDRLAHLRSFRILGPFRYDPMKPMSDQRHGPELLEAAERVDETYIDKNAKPITWSECPAGDYWPQDMHKICGGHNGEAMAYALTHIWSPEEQEVTLLLESGDRMELWIGDAKVFSSDDAGEAETAVEEVRATLRKGWNQLLAKTNEGGGGWGVRIAIDGRHELKESFQIGTASVSERS